MIVARRGPSTKHFLRLLMSPFCNEQGSNGAVRRANERGFAFSILRIYICAVDKKQTDEFRCFRSFPLGRDVQRGGSTGVFGVNVCAVVEEYKCYRNRVMMAHFAQGQ